MTRIAVLDVIQRDFVRTARAKGLGPARILLHHVLRNALMPVVTVLALHLGTLLGGTVLVEYVFNYPGLSGLLVEAVNARDYPIVEGVVLVISVLFVALNLAVDLLLRRARSARAHGMMRVRRGPVIAVAAMALVALLVPLLPLRGPAAHGRGAPSRVTVAGASAGPG